MNAERRRKEEERLRRKREILKRRRRQRRIHLTIVTICIVILAVLGVVAIRRIRDRKEEPVLSGYTENRSETTEGHAQPEGDGSANTGVAEAAAVNSGEEPSPEEEPKADPTPTPSATPTPKPEEEEKKEKKKKEKFTIDNSVEWTYTTDEPMPEGEIVDTSDVHYTYEMMRRDLFFLSERYPDTVTVRNFGTSVDGRELLEAIVGSPEAKADLVFHYSIHAREYINTLLGMKHLEDLLDRYETGQWEGTDIKEILSKVRIHFIPMMNPDGVMISEEGVDAIEDEGIRENLRKVFEDDLALGKASVDINEYWTTWKANARCVDLNRNFATHGWTAAMGTQQPSCSRYPGTEANSEPEVKALVSLTDSMNTVGVISYHSHGRLIFWDYDMWETDHELQQVNYDIGKIVSDLSAVEFDPYVMIEDDSIEHNTGGCSDFYMQVKHVAALTIETGRKFKDNGDYNDPPLSIDNFPLIYAEQKDTVIAIADYFAKRTG